MFLQRAEVADKSVTVFLNVYHSFESQFFKIEVSIFETKKNLLQMPKSLECGVYPAGCYFRGMSVRHEVYQNDTNV